MIVKKNCVNNKESRFQCDRCKTIMGNEIRVLIVTKEPKEVNPTKKWDLCIACYKALKRGIKKGKQ